MTVFGPESVTRSKEKSWVWKRFSVPDASARHWLRIENGGVDGEMKRVTSAMVWLNGRLVVAPWRFHRWSARIDVPVRVRPHNAIWVLVHGKPGSGLSVQLEALDERPPEITEVAPGDGTVVSEPEVTLTVSATDALSGVATVTCNGIEATPIEPDFACTVPLVPGSNAIEVVATDRCGNASRVQLEVVFDPPPVVEITSPADGSVLTANPVVVTGIVDDPTATVTVNGIPATGAPDFTASIVLPAGESTITALARDPAGGEGMDSVEVTLVLGPSPRPVIDAPKPDFVTGGPEDRLTAGLFGVPVRGVVSSALGAGAPDVSVDGTPAEVGPSACSTRTGTCRWSFRSPDHALPEGEQTIAVIATDANGSGGASVSGIVDVCIDGGADGTALADSGQSNRCHVIDGCSTPDWVVDDVQDPAAGELGQSSTAFGKDTDIESPPERFPFGAPVRDKLPCNLHDVCYQTCGSSKTACDDEMKRDMDAVCKKAYPESTCPFSPNVVTCDRWRGEKAKCYTWARRYRAGLRSPQAQDRFELRQNQYCP